MEVKEILKLNKNNPLVRINIKEVIEEYLKNPKADNDVYKELRKMDELDIDEDYIRFAKECVTRNKSIMQSIKDCGVDTFVGINGFIDDMLEFFEDCIDSEYVSNKGTYTPVIIRSIEKEFRKRYSNKDESCWDYAKWLEEMIFSGLRKGTVFEYAIENEIETMKKIIKHRHSLVVEKYGKKSIKGYYANLENTYKYNYLLGKESYDVFHEKQLKFAKDNKLDLNQLYYIDRKLFSVYLDEPFSLILEYISLFRAGIKLEVLWCRSPKEVIDTSRVLKQYTNLIDREVFSRIAVRSIVHNEIGFTKFYRISKTFEDWSEENFKILADLGFLTETELYRLNESIKNGDDIEWFFD